MMLRDRNPSQNHIDDQGTGEAGVSITRSRSGAGAAALAPSTEPTSSPYTIGSNGRSNIEAPAANGSAPSQGKRWWLLAAVSAILLTALTIAGVYLVTKRPTTVDQLVILTVPSGADIKLDAKEYGHSPVKLERLAIGTYTLTISKDGFEPIVEPITITESGPYEFKLKPIPPADIVNEPAEEQIRTYQQRAEEAFARGNYGIVYEGSALYYADNIKAIDSNNAFAVEMRQRVKIAAHQAAQAAIPRGDLAQAQEIYNFLIENYQDDEEARAAATRVEAQLASKRGEVRDLLKKAEDALQAGRLADPLRTSAYFYSKQALAIDRQNDKAKQIRNQVRENLATAGEQALARGDIEAAIKQLDQVGQLFPEDKQARARIREIEARRAETVKVTDPNVRRLRGLQEYRNENYEDAIPDLESAVVNGQSSQAVVFSLARSYFKIGNLEKAEHYFKLVKPNQGDDAYNSSVASLGDIAFQQGDTGTAVERWKQARQLGGSGLFTVAALDDKIEKIEKRQREKAAEPTPLAIQVKHIHTGFLGGSCSGTLTINSTGVRYDGEHVFASNLMGAGISFTKDEVVIKFQGNSQKFRVARGEAERIRETLARYQQTYSPSK
jgi:tetratricopeptide (TPR) repeat protein